MWDEDRGRHDSRLPACPAAHYTVACIRKWVFRRHLPLYRRQWACCRYTGAGGSLNSMADVKITVKPNGPYRVEGVVKLVDAEGREWDLTGKPAFSLCRCGASTTKPFCDGTHSKLGFQAAESAVRKEEAAKGQAPPPNPVTKM